jgi:hypothetical protein
MIKRLIVGNCGDKGGVIGKTEDRLPQFLEVANKMGSSRGATAIASQKKPSRFGGKDKMV